MLTMNGVDSNVQGLRIVILKSKCLLTCSTPTPHNDQTYSKYSSAKADELFECV